MPNLEQDAVKIIGIPIVLSVLLGLTFWFGTIHGQTKQQLIDAKQATKNTQIAAKKQSAMQASAADIASKWYQTMAKAQAELGGKDAKIKQLEKLAAQRSAANGGCTAAGSAGDKPGDLFTYQLWNIAAATNTLPPDPHRQTIDATRISAQVIQDAAEDIIRLKHKVNALQATLLKIQPEQ